MQPRLVRWSESNAAPADGPRTNLLDTSPSDRYEALARMPFLGELLTMRAQAEEVTHCRRRDPLFDDRVLRYVAALPPDALMAGGYARGLLREAMAEDCHRGAYLVLGSREVLRAHSDPTGAEDREVDDDEAREIAAEDPALIYVGRTA